MARGFDSKNVEEQQAQAAERKEERSDGARPTPEEIERKRKRTSIELVLTKTRNDLQNSTEPRHRQRAARQELLPGHRIQPRGRRADRARLPLRGRGGRHRGGGHDGQYPGHRRLRHTGPICRGDSCPPRLSRDEPANSNAAEGSSRAWSTGKSWTIMQRVRDRRHDIRASIPATLISASSITCVCSISLPPA